MTEQLPEELLNECKDLDFEGLELIGIVGDMKNKPDDRRRYPLKVKATPSEDVVSSDLWRGYVSHYRLTSERELILGRFEYPFDKGRKPDDVHEKLEGDFWLDLCEYLDHGGKFYYVPFVDGKGIFDRAQWVVDQGRVTK